jgi:hypothetical protein
MQVADNHAAALSVDPASVGNPAIVLLTSEDQQRQDASLQQQDDTVNDTTLAPSVSDHAPDPAVDEQPGQPGSTTNISAQAASTTTHRDGTDPEVALVESVGNETLQQAQQASDAADQQQQHQEQMLLEQASPQLQAQNLSDVNEQRHSQIHPPQLPQPPTHLHAVTDEAPSLPPPPPPPTTLVPASTQQQSSKEQAAGQSSSRRRRINLASASDGASVLAANSEARKPERTIDGDDDSFMKNDCAADKWMVVELSQVSNMPDKTMPNGCRDTSHCSYTGTILLAYILQAPASQAAGLAAHERAACVCAVPIDSCMPELMLPACQQAHLHEGAHTCTPIDHTLSLDPTPASVPRSLALWRCWC